MKSKCVTIILVAIISGCSMNPPIPFELGEVVRAPSGCLEFQVRGGFCSLQFALDEIHDVFKYTPDHVTHAEEGLIDKWQYLPEDGRGDCEDFALSLRRYLNDRGVFGTKLLLVKDEDGRNHIALELNGWIMDNQSRFVRKRTDVEWEFISAGDENGVWKAISG